jgi:hypothetical protein
MRKCSAADSLPLTCGAVFVMAHVDIYSHHSGAPAAVELGNTDIDSRNNPNCEARILVSASREIRSDDRHRLPWIIASHARQVENRRIGFF